MADDINKKITVDVQVNTDGQQQVDQYKASFESLRTSISALGKPLSELSKNIGSLNDDMVKLVASNEKIANKLVDTSRKAADQRARVNAESNQKLKTSLSESDKLKEQALVRELQRNYQYYGILAAAESDQYARQKKKLDDLFKQKGMSQQLYNKQAEKLLKDHYTRLQDIIEQYANDDTFKKAGLQAVKALNIGLPLPDRSNLIKNATLSQDQLTDISKKAEEKRSRFSIATAKKTFSKIFGLFVKSEANKNASAGAGVTKLQTVIGVKTLQTTQDIVSSAYKIFTDGLQLQTQAKIKSLDDAKDKELANTSLTAAKKTAIENKYKQKEAQVQLKAFKEKQKADIAQAVINGAVAITKVTSQSGIAAPIMIGAVIAETALQIATIAKQKPPAMARGGYFKSDGKGSVLPGYSRSDDTNAFLRSGEGVVVSEAMRDPWARNLVSAINVAYGGKDFSVPNPTRGYAIGGIFTDGGNANRYYNQPVTDQKNLANTIAYQMINNFPPVYVDVKDINNQQNILAQTVNRVNL